MFRGDIKTISFITHALAFFFPAFTFTWVLPEFKSSIEMELGNIPFFTPSYAFLIKIIERFPK